MKKSAILLIVFLSLGQVQAQRTFSAPRTVIVIPFENASSAPGLEWISEAFPVILAQRLASPTTYVFSRNDRIRAYDRAGIPTQVHPTRATIYRIVEQMDVDYAVLGYFTFDGKVFACKTQMLDMRRQKLLPEYSESGPLPELIRIESMLAWDLLQGFGEPSVSRDAFLNSTPQLRLDAFENYVRGLMAPTGPDKIRYLQQAVRLNPSYNEAWLELGKGFFDDRQYAQAVSSLAQVAQSDPASAEANFYLGLAAFYQSDFPRAESAFGFVANRMPLPEVYNNLGVVNARRGRTSSTGFFQKSVQQDPNDADYRFNLGVALYVAGDSAGAAQQLKISLGLMPSDSEARALLDSISGATTTPGGIVRIPQ